MRRAVTSTTRNDSALGRRLQRKMEWREARPVSCKDGEQVRYVPARAAPYAAARTLQGRSWWCGVTSDEAITIRNAERLAEVSRVLASRASWRCVRHQAAPVQVAGIAETKQPSERTADQRASIAGTCHGLEHVPSLDRPGARSLTRPRFRYFARPIPRPLQQPTRDRPSAAHDAVGDAKRTFAAAERARVSKVRALSRLLEAGACKSGLRSDLRVTGGVGMDRRRRRARQLQPRSRRSFGAAS